MTFYELVSKLCLYTKILDNNIPIPIMNKPIVGVKDPVSGVGGAVVVGVFVAFGVADEVDVGVLVARFVGVAEGVDSKAGPSDA